MTAENQIRRPLGSRVMLRAADLLADASAALLIAAQKGQHPVCEDDPCPDTPLSNLTAHTLERIGLRDHAGGRANELSWALLCCCWPWAIPPTSPIRCATW